MKIMKSPVLTRIVFQPFFCYYFVYDAMGAHSSAWLERYLDMVEVIGSSPIEPTITKKKCKEEKQRRFILQYVKLLLSIGHWSDFFYFHEQNQDFIPGWESEGV